MKVDVPQEKMNSLWRLSLNSIIFLLQTAIKNDVDVIGALSVTLFGYDTVSDGDFLWLWHILQG
jgi:hypothetical protein